MRSLAMCLGLSLAACGESGVHPTEIPSTEGSSIPESESVGRLVGQVIGPPGTEFEDVIILLSGDDVRWAKFAWYTEVSADGSFDLGPLPASRIAIDLVFLRSEIAEAVVPYLRPRIDGLHLDLGHVAIEANTPTRREFDVTDLFPGEVHFEVRLNGEATPELLTEARPGNEEIEWARGMTDAAGNVVLRLLPATWSLYVELGGDYYSAGRWKYAVPTPIAVRPGEKVEAVVDVPLYEAQVTVIDSDSGLPVAHELVACRSKSGGNIRRTADDGGRISLILPPGTYEFYRALRGSHPFEPVEVEWTSLGPVPDTVSLAEPEPIDE